MSVNTIQVNVYTKEVGGKKPDKTMDKFRVVFNYSFCWGYSCYMAYRAWINMPESEGYRPFIWVSPVLFFISIVAFECIRYYFFDFFCSIYIKRNLLGHFICRFFL